MGDKQYFKEQWVDLFRAVGIDDETMKRWHGEFERRSPDAHQSFLEWLAIPLEEIAEIRARSRS